jgi:leucyl/phenylalanyl-tRNA--protein transferase
VTIQTEFDPSPWVFDRAAWPDTDAVAAGGDLEPATVIAAYRAGAFPMFHDGELLWWSPMRRGVLEPDQFRASRSLRRSARRFQCTVDRDFEAVIDACADPARAGAWINAETRDAYVHLHELGWAHSVEARDSDGELVGGLYGLQVGRLFAGESMFHHRTDASKVALMTLIGIQRGGLIDVQWSTPHLASLGVTEISREEYFARIDTLVDESPPDWPPSG